MPAMPAAARATAGIIGWLREHSVLGPLNIALTLLSLLFCWWIVPPLLNFLIFDAIWSGERSHRLYRDAGSRRASAPAGRS